MNNANLQGFDELDSLLRMMPEEIGRRVLNKAVLDGARVVAKEMRIRAPVGDDADEGGSKGRKPGFLRRNIRARMARPSEYGDNRFVTAALAGVSSKAWYAKLIEYGWVFTSSKGKGVRFIGPRPFLRPAWDSTKAAALATVSRSLAIGIEQAAIRLAGRYRTSGFSRRGRTFIG
jgi:hypothetical protein